MANEKTWAALTHVAAFVGCLVPFVGWIVGPMVVWLFKKEESSFVDFHGRSCLNFHISMLIYSVVAGLLVLVFVGIFLLLAIFVCQIVFTIVAALRASDGKYYRYPLSITFLELPPEGGDAVVVDRSEGI